MSWGPSWFYYRCPNCGKKFRSETGLMALLGEKFDRCPKCGAKGEYEADGPARPGAEEYEETEP